MSRSGRLSVILWRQIYLLMETNGPGSVPRPQLEEQSGWLAPRGVDAAETETLDGEEVCRASRRASDLKSRSLKAIAPQGR